MVEEIGAYAPMIPNGLIVVNGVVASCHSVTDMLSLQHTFFRLMRQSGLLSLMWQQSADSSIDDIGSIVNLPIGTWSLLSVLKYIIPNGPFIS
uniref:Hedgehog protein Hint domain-containing protein n=1 Tax=Plectus sambesii TaxID=2011161 RepID=A0A914V1A0_9BILA